MTQKDNKKGLMISKAVVTLLSNLRRSRAKTKKRGEVSGGGRKPFRQKGTGRARSGSNRSPLWRGGGVVFGPNGLQNFKKKVNHKEKNAAKRLILDKKRDSVFRFAIPKITKTKEATDFIEKNNLQKPLLILVSSSTNRENNQDFVIIKKNFRNIPQVKVINEHQANVYDILRAKNIVYFDKGSNAKTKTVAKKEKA